MNPEQLDFFRDFGAAAVTPLVAASARSTIDVAALDDDGLVAALASADPTDSLPLVTEAALRRLAAAVPLLLSLCRRHAGYGARRPIPEQIAALNALHAIDVVDGARLSASMCHRVIVGNESHEG